MDDDEPGVLRTLVDALRAPARALAWLLDATPPALVAAEAVLAAVLLAAAVPDSASTRAATVPDAPFAGRALAAAVGVALLLLALLPLAGYLPPLAVFGALFAAVVALAVSVAMTGVAGLQDSDAASAAARASTAAQRQRQVFLHGAFALAVALLTAL